MCTIATITDFFSFDGNHINKYKTWMTEDTSARGARENIVSEYKTWVTEDKSAWGECENK